MSLFIFIYQFHQLTFWVVAKEEEQARKLLPTFARLAATLKQKTPAAQGLCLVAGANMGFR